MNAEPLKILYTDDDLDDFELIQDGLSQVAPQHILHYVRNAVSFIDEVREFAPHIILLDYNMPLCDGAECLQRLKQSELNHIPVIMYCTSSSRNTLQECYELGAVRYLLKPVDYAGMLKGLDLLIKLYYDGGLIPSNFDQFFIDTYKLN